MATSKKTPAKKVQTSKKVSTKDVELPKAEPEEAPKYSKKEEYLVKFTFTESEINAKAKKMADHNAKIQALTSELLSKINGEHAAFNELMGHVVNGYEYQKVQCDVKLNCPEPGKKSYFYDDVLVDNGVEMMLASDFQTELKFNHDLRTLAESLDDKDLNITMVQPKGRKSPRWLSSITNLEQLKANYEDSCLIYLSVDDFLNTYKRGIGLEFGTSEIHTGQTLKKHLEETKNLELFLQKIN